MGNPKTAFKIPHNKRHYLSKECYEELDQLHFKVENELLKLIKSLQRKLNAGDWEDTFRIMEQRSLE